MAKLPIIQADGLLEIQEISAAKLEGEDRQCLPSWADKGATALAVDAGLLALVPSPLNPDRTLAVCDSIHRTALHDDNERRITANPGDARSFASLRAVRVVNHKAIPLVFSSPGADPRKRDGGRGITSAGRVLIPGERRLA
jgi:hypothetical protein